jgi:hypothetical protein
MGFRTSRSRCVRLHVLARAAAALLARRADLLAGTTVRPSGDPIQASVGAKGIFTVANGQGAGAVCDPAPASGDRCNIVDFYWYGPTTIHVAVPGYQPTDVSTNVEAVEGNCGCMFPKKMFESTLSLTRSP